MCEGGIYDQIGGGFCRYSVDERWEIPHFEKMLYDNGPLLALCADAWAHSGEPPFARVAEETAAWVMREMQAPDGGYLLLARCRLGGRGRQVLRLGSRRNRALLTPQESALAARRWGFDGPPNFENPPLARHGCRRLDDAEIPLLAARAKSFSPRANGACARVATTRS
jgi:uncharacterized protein YyaL (SSP411 family)